MSDKDLRLAQELPAITLAMQPPQDSTRSSLESQEPTLSNNPEQATTTIIASPLAPTLLGPYQLLEKLGEGGMGAVYKARHKKLDKLVAIKLLPAHLTRDPAALARFEREMKAVGKLEHPNIARAMDADEVDGTHYLAMEFVDGQDLEQVVKKRGKLSVVAACKLIRQTAIALDYAPQHSLVHRDIKPSNLILTKAGQVKLLDLGLARLAQEEGQQDLTSTGQCFGTPDYMAPEQWEDAHSVDARCDLYALGCTLFFLLTGRAPYSDDAHRSTVSKMQSHSLDASSDLRALRPNVPRELAALCAELLAKSPADRPDSAKIVADRLTPFCKTATGDFQSHISATVVVPASATVNLSERPATSESPAPATVVFAPTAPPQPQVKPVAAAAQQPPRNRRRLTLALAGGAALLLLLGAIIIKITNNDGTVTEIKVPEGSKIEITDSSIENQKSKIENSSWHGWPADAPPPAIAPFDAEQAQHHQEAWAKYLGVPVEYTNSLGMKFRLIPPGEFLMGSTPEEIEAAIKGVSDDKETVKRWQDRIKSEAPQHMVILTQPIYLGVNEVTQAEYKKVMGVNPSYFAPQGRGNQWVAGLETTEHPVEVVSWYDAAEFCAKLSKQEKLKPFYFLAGEIITPLDGTGYRLPSEAEWEFACRAGTATKWWTGDQDADLERAGRFGGLSTGRTHPAGEFNANPFGLSDIHGNIWEWVQDRWDATFYGQFQEKPAINPNSPYSTGSQRVIRGGRWNISASHSRSSSRYAEDPSTRNPHIGFRVSLVAVGSRVSEALKVTGPALPNRP